MTLPDPAPTTFLGEPAHLEPGWFDYNGHLTDWAYGRVLSEANEQVLERLDLSAPYLERTGCSLYTVELRVSYVAEVPVGGGLRARTRVVESGARWLALETDLIRDDDVVAATAHSRYVHVDHARGRSCPFDEGTAERLAALVTPGGPAAQDPG